MLIIHAGAHKTGTTTIQNFLDKESVALKDISVNYINVYREARSIMGCQPGNNIDIDMNVFNNIRNKVDRNYENGKVNIISSEAFFGNFYQGYKNQKYVYSLLSKAFSGYCLKVFYLERDISEFCTSVYIQTIHEGNCWGEKKYFEITEMNKFSWGKAHVNAVSCFGEDKVIKLKMEEASKHQYGLIGGFFKAIGCELDSSLFGKNDGFKKYNKNISYGKKEVLFARCFNKLTFSMFNKYLRAFLSRLSVATNSKKYLSKL